MNKKIPKKSKYGKRVKVCKSCGRVNEIKSKNCNTCISTEFWGKR